MCAAGPLQRGAQAPSTNSAARGPADPDGHGRVRRGPRRPGRSPRGRGHRRHRRPDHLRLAIDEPRAADGWFAGGVLTWESGANAGRSCEVRDWVEASSRITLFLPQPFAIEVGDKFRAYPGCDKRLSTCTGRFANVLNFRGEPHLPGQDAMLSYPDAK